MNKRPIPVTVIGWLFISAGLVGLAYHVTEIIGGHPLDAEAVLVLLVRLLAIVAGGFLLRGQDWARWMLLAWMAYHVVLSFFHSLTEVVMHALMLAVIIYFLFRPAASAYFRSGRPDLSLRGNDPPAAP